MAQATADAGLPRRRLGSQLRASASAGQAGGAGLSVRAPALGRGGRRAGHVTPPPTAATAASRGLGTPRVCRVDGKGSGRVWRSSFGGKKKHTDTKNRSPVFLVSFLLLRSRLFQQRHGVPLIADRGRGNLVAAQVSLRKCGFRLAGTVGGGGGGARPRCQQPRCLPGDATWTAWISCLSISRFRAESEAARTVPRQTRVSFFFFFF